MMETNITIVVILIVLVVLLYLLFGPKQHKRYYFVANEVVFQITHTRPLRQLMILQPHCKNSWARMEISGHKEW
jgi:hypothetical protein